MRTAVVTGASSGLGREFVKQLSEEGKLDEIWVIARRREKLEELASFVKTPLRIFGASLDDEGLYGLLSVLMEREKPDIRLLINNAGRGTMTTLDEETTEDAVSMIGLNCQAPVKMMKLCLPYMKEGAGIINVASVAGLLDLAVYGATKAFLLSLSQAVNEEMKERNIHVMALCPYWIKDTEFIGKAGAEGRISEKGILNAEETVKKALEDLRHGETVSLPGKMAKLTALGTRFAPLGLVWKIRKWMKV